MCALCEPDQQPEHMIQQATDAILRIPTLGDNTLNALFGAAADILDSAAERLRHLDP